MYKNLLEVLRCPICNEKLDIDGHIDKELVEGNLVCTRGHTWVVKEGIVDFKSKEQEARNNWSIMYEKFDYKTWDDILLSKLSPEQISAGDITHNKIVETLKKEPLDWILDIGTGRGILLKAMLESDIKNIVCLDLSYEVLKCDRIKFLESFPHMEVNYIACDARNLPFEDMTFDMAVSLAGFTNMHEEVHEALKESIRVSKKGVLSAATISECEHIKSVEEEHFAQIHEVGQNVTIDTVIKEETFKVLMCQIKPS